MHEPIEPPEAPAGPPAKRLSLVRPGGTAGEAAAFLGWSATVLIYGAETGGRSALVETLGARGASLPWHIHDGEDEVLYVAEGEVTVYRADGGIPLGAGEAVSLPRGDEHSCVVESEEARVLSFYTPAGFEEAILEMEDEPEASSLEHFVTVAARHGCDITGPPPRETEPKNARGRSADATETSGFRDPEIPALHEGYRSGGTLGRPGPEGERR